MAGISILKEIHWIYSFHQAETLQDFSLVQLVNPRIYTVQELCLIMTVFTQHANTLLAASVAMWPIDYAFKIVDYDWITCLLFYQGVGWADILLRFRFRIQLQLALWCLLMKIADLFPGLSGFLTNCLCVAYLGRVDTFLVQCFKKAPSVRPLVSPVVLSPITHHMQLVLRSTLLTTHSHCILTGLHLMLTTINVLIQECWFGQAFIGISMVVIVLGKYYCLCTASGNYELLQMYVLCKNCQSFKDCKFYAIECCLPVVLLVYVHVYYPHGIFQSKSNSRLQRVLSEQLCEEVVVEQSKYKMLRFSSFIDWNQSKAAV